MFDAHRPEARVFLKPLCQCTAHACQHLGFDAEGSYTVNELAAAALLNRPEVAYKPATHYAHEAFFEVASAANANHRVVDGFIDAQVGNNAFECARVAW